MHTLSSNLGLIIGVSVASVVAIFLIVLIVVLIVVSSNNRKYKKFVLCNSEALKELRLINEKYQFKKIANFDMQHCYDNEHYYDAILCSDYLTYELVDIQDAVKKALKNTLENSYMFEEYREEVEKRCTFGRFNVPNVLKNKDKLNKYEEYYFKRLIQTPTTKFSINVELILTNINGVYKKSKSETFSHKEIKNIIFKLNQKAGSFYIDLGIWNALSRVERGKVTNKIRFKVYEKDGYRCRKCGSKNNLEIDHIIPIARGGKSTFDNLQTLCHDCNQRKRNN